MLVWVLNTPLHFEDSSNLLFILITYIMRLLKPVRGLASRDLGYNNMEA